MKQGLLIFVLFITACAPVNKTITNVSRFVQGMQIVSYNGSSPELSSALLESAQTLQMGGSYRPLATTMYTSDKLTLSTRALKGSISRSLDAKDFSLEVAFVENKVENKAVTEVSFRPSDSDLAKAQEVIKNLIAELDKRYSRYTP